MNKQYSFLKIMVPLFIVMAVIGTSCKKYIYQAPITSTYGKEFWTSQTSVEQAELAMYGQLRSCITGSTSEHQSFFVNGDLAAGTFLPAAGEWNYATIQASHSPAFNFSYVPYLEPDLQNWSRFYQVIAQANLIIENVGQMSKSLFDSENKRNAYIAEALFMRAYTYFYITRIWGDPIYVTKTYNDVDYGKIPPIARTPESIVLDSCIADLKTAAGYVKFSGGDPTKTLRANKGTVYALLAHIYAWKHEYADAHLACQQLITNGGYSLEPMATYTNIWKGQSSSENIWEIAMKYNPNDPNFPNEGDGNYHPWAEAQFSFFGTFLKGPIVNNLNSSCWVSPAGGFVDQFYDTTNDARYKAILAYTPGTGGDGNGYIMIKYTNFQYQQPTSQSLPYINNNLVLLRLSDIILLDAEASASTGDFTNARTDLAVTENRAGINTYQIPTSQSEMLDSIVVERGRELIGEGQWYYDLIRTEPTQGWLEKVGYPADGRVNATNKGYYWPLNMATLFPQDNLLTQNPYWATHK